MARILRRGQRPVIHNEEITTSRSLTEVPTQTIRWVKGERGEIPSGAVPGGSTLDGETVYIGRTRLPENHNELTPGLIIPSARCVMVSYGTGVRRSTDYEVLTTTDQSTIHWLPCNYGNVPANSVIGGIDCSYLEPLFVGRTSVDVRNGRTWRGRRLALVTGRGDPDSVLEIQLPGKVHRSHKCLYVPYDDKEYLFRDYEVLALKESPAPLLAICRKVIRRHIFEDIDNDANEEYENRAKILDSLPLPTKLKEYCKLPIM